MKNAQYTVRFNHTSSRIASSFAEAERFVCAEFRAQGLTPAYRYAIDADGSTFVYEDRDAAALDSDGSRAFACIAVESED